MPSLGRGWLLSGTDSFHEQMGSQAVLTALLLSLLPQSPAAFKEAGPAGGLKSLECAGEEGQNVDLGRGRLQLRLVTFIVCLLHAQHCDTRQESYSPGPAPRVSAVLTSYLGDLIPRQVH